MAFDPTTFQDAANREWRIDLDDVLLDRIERAFRIDLLSSERPPFADLARNPRRFIQLLVVICGEQIKSLGITEEDFRRAIKPQQLEPAGRALLEAVGLFFPADIRSARQSLLDQSHGMAMKADTLAAAKMNDPRVVAAMEREADKALEQALQAGFLAPSKVAGDTTPTRSSAGNSPDAGPLTSIAGSLGSPEFIGVG